MKFKLLPIAASVAVLFQPALAEAEWNPDTSILHEIDGAGAASKSVVDSEGNIITAYSDAGNRYDFYLEKTSRDGVPLWSGERKLIVDRDQSFIVRWSLETDSDNAIYTGVEDLANRRSVIAKTNTDGTPAWDAPYVPEADNHLQGLTIELAHSAVAGLGYTYSYDDFSRRANLQVGMLDDTTGELKWKTDFTVPSGSSILVQSIEATKDGIVVMGKANRASDSLSALFVQKYDFDGNPLWGDEPKLVTPYLTYSSGNVVKLNADGDGGVAFAWLQHDINNNANVFIQHINSKGKNSFNEGGLRISHGSSLEYDAINRPTVTVSADDVMVTWVAQSPGGIPTYTLFAQRVNFDGDLLLGDEPKGLKTTIGANEHNWEVYNGGQLTRYGDQYSMVYARAENAASTISHLDRIDFNANGEVIRNVNYADIGTYLLHPSVSRSLYGETVSSFSTQETISTLSSIKLQSMDLEGQVGINSGIALEYPRNPWVIEEGSSLATDLRFLDEVNSTYNISISSSNEAVIPEITTISEGKFSIVITPDAEFSGVAPFTIQVTDAGDPTRSKSLAYKVRVKPVNDAPIINAPDSVDVNEGQAAVVEAEISDPDTESLSVVWTQTAGQVVEFDPNAENLSFDAPAVTSDETLEFLLSVSDEDTTTEKAVSVNVIDQGKPNLSISSVNVQEGQTANINPQLSGAKEPLSVEWTQVDGPELTMSSTSELSIQVSAPFVDSDSSATLSLAITDANGDSVEQSVTVNISNNSSGNSGGGSSNWLLICLLTAAAFIRRSIKA
ncbi:hypothetical protein DZA50_03745 [Kangiella sp. HD9-110m-PIT-SAG07]|nr:hypothetical protein DZA50_03745 [Kangiella sp. HD9-110m-PIT-SAG07]